MYRCLYVKTTQRFVSPPYQVSFFLRSQQTHTVTSAAAWRASTCLHLGLSHLSFPHSLIVSFLPPPICTLYPPFIICCKKDSKKEISATFHPIIPLFIFPSFFLCKRVVILVAFFCCWIEGNRRRGFISTMAVKREQFDLISSCDFHLLTICCCS